MKKMQLDNIKISDVYELTLSQNKIADDYITKKILRPISSVITYPAVKLRIHPNWITLLFILIGTFATIFIDLDNSKKLYFVSSLFLLYYIFDLSDGYVARILDKQSKIGKYLDSLGHFIINSCVSFKVSDNIYEAICLSILFSVSISIYYCINIDNSYIISFIPKINKLKIPKISRILGKIFIFPIENPGISYTFLFCAIIDSAFLIIKILYISAISTIFLQSINILYPLIKRKKQWKNQATQNQY